MRYYGRNRCGQDLGGSQADPQGAERRPRKRGFSGPNADPAITEPIEAQCKSSAVKYVWVKSMSDLGRACGIEVGAAAAARVQ